MDSTAIKAISDLALAGQCNEALEAIKGLNAIILPNGYAVSNLENYLENPRHFRGKFSTSILEQFNHYVHLHCATATSVFIDPENMSALSIMDMVNTDGEIQWGRHRVNLTLRKTPDYKAIVSGESSAGNSYWFDQEGFVDFVADWAENLTFTFDSDAEPISGKDSIKLFRTMKYSNTATSEASITNHSKNLTDTELLEAKAAGGAEIPTGFTFTTVPYAGFDSVDFNCILRTEKPGDKILFRYRISQLETLKNKMAEELSEKINSFLTENISGITPRIYIGNMEYQPDQHE